MKKNYIWILVAAVVAYLVWKNKNLVPVIPAFTVPIGHDTGIGTITNPAPQTSGDNPFARGSRP